MIRDNNSISLPGRVKNQISFDIMKGIIKPGDKITEETYANKLNVSRAPVREAILMLITEGVAHKIENRGTFLKIFTLDEQLDLHNLRFYLERQSLKKIGQQKDHTALIDDLTRNAKKMINNRNDIYEIIHSNYHFHHSFIRHSGSSIYLDKYPSFYTEIHYFHENLTLDNTNYLLDHVNKTIDEHRGIIDSIMKYDFNRAKDFLISHNQYINDLLNDLKNIDTQ